MNCKIIEKQSFTLIGKSIKVSTENGENFKVIPKFWGTCFQDGTCQALLNLSENRIMYGVCTNFDSKSNTFTYMIAINKPKKVHDFESHEISPSKWAIFEANGPLPNSIQNVLKQVYKDWFPSVHYEHKGTDELEVYFPDGEDGIPHSEIWIPVK